MDEFTPQTGGKEVKEGHEESDLSIRGIIISAIVLAAAGFLSFLLMKVMLSWGLPWAEAQLFPQPAMTATQKQLVEDREGHPAPKAEEAVRVPEAPGRENEEQRLQKTFPVPRLQYDDVLDLNTFRNSENQWLASSGTDATGNSHVPVDQAMDAIVKNGLPAVSGSFAAPTLPTAVPMVPAGQQKK